MIARLRSSVVRSSTAWAATAMMGVVVGSTAPAVAQVDAAKPAVVTITIGEARHAIPADFVGLSFETKRTLAEAYMPSTQPTAPTPPRLFSADDKPLIAFFKTLGVRSLRIGGNTADRATVPLPTHDDIDAVFRFATAADVKVIYTLRLKDMPAEQIAATAQYVWEHHSAALSHFAIGNEPDAFFRTYDEYRAKLEAALEAVRAVAPEARFCGPCTTQAHPEWAANVARDFGGRAGFELVAQHFYPCSDGKKATDSEAAIEKLLSPQRIGDYERLRDKCLPAARENGAKFRLEETNNFYNGGAPNASNTFASSLWALDFMHWWALNGAAGFNFHSSDFFPVTPDDKATWYVAFAKEAGRDGYAAKPLAYALAAFNAAAPERVLALTLNNSGNSNVTAYATARKDGQVLLTVINKSNGTAARPVEMVLPNELKPTRWLELIAPEARSTADITLGGRSIDRDGSWSGTFEKAATFVEGKPLIVAPTSAIVIELERLAPGR